MCIGKAVNLNIRSLRFKSRHRHFGSNYFMLILSKQTANRNKKSLLLIVRLQTAKNERRMRQRTK